jgi:hypothetical protein
MMPRAQGITLSGLAGLVLLLTMCNSSSGPETADAAPDEGTSDARVHDAPRDVSLDRDDSGDAGDAEARTCSECLASHCTAEFTFCAKVADCFAIAECAGDKLDAPGCICSHPGGASSYLDLARCKLDEACSPDCQSSCLDVEMQANCDLVEGGVAPPVCDGGLPTSEASVQDCSGCIEVSCAQQDQLCAEGSDCIAYETCLFSCRTDDPGCSTACQMEHPEGYGLTQSLFDCVQQNCGSPCGG